MGLKDKLKVTRIKGKKIFLNSRSWAMATLVYSPFSKLIVYIIFRSRALRTMFALLTLLYGRGGYSLSIY